jgi:hypothetical protein
MKFTPNAGASQVKKRSVMKNRVTSTGLIAACFHFNAEHLSQLAAIAKDHGQSTAAYLRFLIDAEVRRAAKDAQK